MGYVATNTPRKHRNAKLFIDAEGPPHRLISRRNVPFLGTLPTILCGTARVGRVLGNPLVGSCYAYVYFHVPLGRNARETPCYCRERELGRTKRKRHADWSNSLGSPSFVEWTR